MLFGQYEALAWLCGGLGFFATLGLAATLNNKASKIPYVSAKYFIVIFYFLLDGQTVELLAFQQQ